MSVILRVLGILSLGILPLADGAFTLEGEIKRKAYIYEYVLPAFILSLLGAGIYRILLYFGVIFSLNYDARRLLFSLLLSPALFTLFVGQAKRLSYLGFWKVLMIFNFYPFYWGTACLTLILAIFPDVKIFRPQKHRKHK